MILIYFSWMTRVSIRGNLVIKVMIATTSQAHPSSWAVYNNSLINPPSNSELTKKENELRQAEYLWRSQDWNPYVSGSKAMLATALNYEHHPLSQRWDPSAFQPCGQPLGAVLGRQLTRSRTWCLMVTESVSIFLSFRPDTADCRGSSKTQVCPLGTGTVLGWNLCFDVLSKKMNREKCFVPDW